MLLIEEIFTTVPVLKKILIQIELCTIANFKLVEVFNTVVNVIVDKIHLQYLKNVVKIHINKNCQKSNKLSLLNSHNFKYNKLIIQ